MFVTIAPIFPSPLNPFFASIVWRTLLPFHHYSSLTTLVSLGQKIFFTSKAWYFEATNQRSVTSREAHSIYRRKHDSCRKVVFSATFARTREMGLAEVLRERRVQLKSVIHPSSRSRQSFDMRFLKNLSSLSSLHFLPFCYGYVSDSLSPKTLRVNIRGCWKNCF